MQRRHLFEFGDQDWLPSRFRQQLTDLLAHQVERGRLYHPIVPMLAQALAKSGSKRVLDLCSGGGTSIGILQAVEQELGRELQIRLTDKFPTVTLQHRAAARERHVAEAESIDASSVPAHLLGFRTMFTAFHHFKPAQCQEILGDAVRAAQPIAIFEFTQRSAKFLVLGALVGFPVVLASCLTLRPWTLYRIFWTFVLPIIPLMYYWDGFASGMRSYHPDELRELTKRADCDNRFSWDIGQVPGNAGTTLTYVVGLPRYLS